MTEMTFQLSSFGVLALVGMTMLSVGNADRFTEPTTSKDAEQARILIEQGADVNEKGSGGNSPLHLAAFANSTDVAKLLIAHGALVNAVSDSGGTPLHIAAAR